MDINQLVSFYTIAAFYIAWSAFSFERKNNLQKRKEEKIDILKSIDNELVLMNSWLGGSYDDLNYTILQDPWHPFHMVYGLVRNDAVKNAISLKSVSLLSENLLKTLVFFNQKLGSFEQHVNRLVQFNTSDPVMATKAFYYYDRVFSKYNRTKKWIEFEKLARRLLQGKYLSPEKIHLIGSVRVLKDLHIFGIGSNIDNDSLISRFNAAKYLIKIELNNINKEKQFKQPLIITILDVVVFSSILLLILNYILKGGVIMLTLNSNTIISLGVITIVSLILGYIKFGSVAASRKEWSWQLNFVEFWNDTINFFLSGLIAYYFIFIRWQQLSTGSSINAADIILFLIFAMGLFGHLCVLSNNITKGVEAILDRILK